MKITIQNYSGKPGVISIVLAAFIWLPTFRLLLSHSLDDDRDSLAAANARGCELFNFFLVVCLTPRNDDALDSDGAFLRGILRR
jgi:hypothetical protein